MVMKNLLTKKNSLIVSSACLLVSYVLANPVLFGICKNIYQFANYTGCLDKLSQNLSESLLYGAFPALFFSILTYKMPEVVFISWAKFAVWAAPLLVVLVFLVSSSNNGLGIEGAIGSAFSSVISGAICLLFVSVSIWRIIAARKKLK